MADYHHKRISPEGKRQYQTALIFDDVSEESLCGPASHFLTDLFRLVGGEHKEGATERTEEEIRTLYQELLPQLHGTIAEPSTDERLWRHDQMGGSCATSCGLSLLRSQMTKEEFKALRALARVDVFYQTYIDMTRNQQPDLRQAYIGLDAVMRLEKSFRKQQRSLPEPFVAMRQEIEQRRAQILAQAASLPRPAVQGVAATGPLSRTGGASTLSAHMEPESEAVREREASPIQLLTKAVQILRKDHFSEEAFKEAEPLIVTLLSDSVQSHSLTEQEQKQLHALCQDLYDRFKPSPTSGFFLSLKHTFLLTALMTATKRAIESASPEISLDKKMRENIEVLEESIHDRFLQLRLQSYSFADQPPYNAFVPLILQRQTDLLALRAKEPSLGQLIMKIKNMGQGERRRLSQAEYRDLLECSRWMKLLPRTIQDKSFCDSLRRAFQKCPQESKEEVLRTMVDHLPVYTVEEKKTYDTLQVLLQSLLEASSLPEETKSAIQRTFQEKAPPS